MKRFLGIALVLIMALALTLTACGKAPVSQSGGNALRVGWTAEPDVLNPLTSYSTESSQITGLVYETLLAYDTALEPVCRLAESYEYSDDGLVATYHLRQDVKWHDGEAFTADDVLCSFHMVMEYGLSDAAQFAEAIAEITVPDEYTVVIRFDARQAFNVALGVPILPDHIWGDFNGEDIELFANDNPIGTGAMKFVEWKQGETLTLAKNEDYYGAQPGPDRIIFIEYGNEDVLAQALKAGEIDIITEVSPTVWEGLVGVENIKAVSLDSFSFHMIAINVNTAESSGGNPLLLDKTIRQALNYAMDRQQITEIALAGHGNPGETIVPQGLGDWNYKVPDDIKMDGDIEKAKALLDAAGYVDADGDGVREKDGAPLEFRMYAIESTTVDVRSAQIFRDSAAEAGINLVLTTMDENTMGDIIFDVDNTDFDLFVWGWDTTLLDPGDLLSIPLTNQIGNNNDMYYSNPIYDELFVKQAAEMDEAKRMEMVHEMQRIFYEDAAYMVLWYQDKLQAYRTDTWTGWVECPGGIIYNMTYDNYLNVKPAA